MPVGNEQDIPVVVTPSTPTLQAVTDAGATTTNFIEGYGYKINNPYFTAFFGVDELAAAILQEVNFKHEGESFSGKLRTTIATLTNDREYILPDQSGTLALLSDITGGSGITRSINNIAINTTAGATASTDYVYFCTGTLTLTLPTCVSNTNRYTVKCISGTLTIACNGAETIDGSATIGVAVEDSVDIISNNTEWKIV